MYVPTRHDRCWLSPVHPLTISPQVVNGPCFVLLVRGSAEPPNVWYSHASLDFGPCFLHEEGMPAVVSELRVENRDRHPVRYVRARDNSLRPRGGD